MAQRKLRVLANPAHALDHDGQPMCAVLHEGSMEVFVGAEIDRAKSEAEKRIVFSFSTDPVEVACTPYYARKVADGELLPADVDTAKICGVEFESPKPSKKSREVTP